MSLALMRWAAAAAVTAPSRVAPEVLAVAEMEPQLEQQVLLAVLIQAAAGVPAILAQATAVVES
jgi:hypothetical protein